MKKAIFHFKKVDPILYKICIKIGEIEVRAVVRPDNYLEYLCREIVGQQLSGKAAGSIWKKFVSIIPEGKVTPKAINLMTPDDIRAAGLSWAKAKYIKDLAEKVLNKEVHLNKLEKMADEEVIAELVKVKGIGRWTAEMFLIFTLARPDVFSLGDLGLKNAIKKLYGIENPTKEQMEKLSLKWSPYRSTACLILWKSLEV